jgi:lysylphosphatidylglycerol synthetase-like protein (DUF2156 family)
MSLYESLPAVMSLLVVIFALALLVAEFRPDARLPRPMSWQFTQMGDSSLSPRSIHWLGALALVGAVVLGALLT